MADAKPTALVLADILVKYAESAYDTEAAAELRRQHDAIVALSEALERIAGVHGQWNNGMLPAQIAQEAITKHGVKQ
jgi:hypothetical protein